MINDQLSRIAVAAWLHAQVHPTDCLCSFCAPISLPTRSPIINDALAKKGRVDLTQAITTFSQLSERRQRQTMELMTCGLRMEGKMG